MKALDTALIWVFEKTLLGTARVCWFIIGAADRFHARRGK